MAKYNLGGVVIGDSRTSSVILGLSPQKKRVDKAGGKEKSVIGDGTKSVASSKHGHHKKAKCNHCSYIGLSNNVKKHIKENRCSGIKQ